MDLEANVRGHLVVAVQDISGVNALGGIPLVSVFQKVMHQKKRIVVLNVV